MGISIQDPVRLVNVIWYLSLFFVFIFCICAIAFGAQNDDGDEADSGAVGFAGVWTMLLAIFLGVGGTFVLRKFKTPLAVGFLLGVVTLMCVNMLVLCALLDQETQNCNDLNDRLDASIDTCQAIGCQKALYEPTGGADGGPLTNRYLVCCQSMTAYKWGSNDNEFYFRFGEEVNAVQCPECDGGECDGSVAAAVFAAFLFIIYGVFAIALGYYRGSVIATGSAEEAAAEEADNKDETAVSYPVESGDVELSEKVDEKDLSQ